jgi:hypothetical protein
MAVNLGTSLALGIGLTGKPESMARFVQLRAQGKAAAQKAKKDDIDAKNEAIRKQLMSVGGGARLPVFEELYVNRKADVVRRLTEMAGSPDLNAATDMINGLAQDARRWEEQTKIFYADKNDANSYSRKVLQTEKDPLKIAQALNNDAGTLKFDANNPNLLIDDFTYVKPNEYIQKVFSDNNLFQPPTEGNLQRINNQVYSNQVIPEPTINSIIGNSFADKNFNRSMESMFQEQLRAQGKEINRQDPQYQKDYTAFFDNSMRNYGKSLKKSTEVTEAKGGSTFNFGTGAGTESGVGGISPVTFNMKVRQSKGSIARGESKEIEVLSTGEEQGFTIPIVESQAATTQTMLDYNGNTKADLSGVPKLKYGQVAVMPFYKRNAKSPSGKDLQTQGKIIFPDQIEAESKAGNVEYRLIVTGVGELNPYTKNPNSVKASDLSSDYGIDATKVDAEYIEIIRPLTDVQGAINGKLSRADKIAFDENVKALKKYSAEKQREADAMIEGGKKAPAAAPKEKSGSKTGYENLFRKPK